MIPLEGGSALSQSSVFFEAWLSKCASPMECKYVAEELSKKVFRPVSRVFVLCELRDMRASNDFRDNELRKLLIAAS